MDGAQEVRAEDLNAHMQAVIEWAEQINAKRPYQTLKRLDLKREFLMQSTNHLPQSVDL